MHSTTNANCPDSQILKWGLLWGVALYVVAGFSSPLFAQRKKVEPEVESGTIVSVDREKKGKTVLKVKKSSGDEVDIAINAKTPLSISAKGDRGFILPGTTIEGKVTITNPVDVQKKNLNTVFSAFNSLTIFAALANESKDTNKLVGKDFTVHLGTNAPKTQVTPKQDDFNMNQYEVTGMIEGIDADNGILVDFGEELGTHKIFLEAGVNSVDLTLSDPALLKEGSEVEIEGRTLKGKGFVPSRVTAKLEESLVAEDYLPTLDKKPGSGRPKPKAKAKKKAPANNVEP